MDKVREVKQGESEFMIRAAEKHKYFVMIYLEGDNNKIKKPIGIQRLNLGILRQEIGRYTSNDKEGLKKVLYKHVDNLIKKLDKRS